MVQRRDARFVENSYGMYESVTRMLEELIHGLHYQKDVKTFVSFFSINLSTIWSWYPIHAQKRLMGVHGKNVA